MDRSAHPSIHPRGKLMLGDLGKTPPLPSRFFNWSRTCFIVPLSLSTVSTFFIGVSAATVMFLPVGLLDRSFWQGHTSGDIFGLDFDISYFKYLYEFDISFLKI